MSEDDGYKVRREIIAKHAASVGAEGVEWNNAAVHLKEARLDPLTFSGLGERFAKSYESIIEDYGWCMWRVGVILDKVEGALGATAKNYGRAEAVAEDDIRRVGEQF